MPRIDRSRLPEFAEAFEKGASVSQLRDEYNLGSRAVLRRLMEAGEEGRISEAALARLLIDRTQHDFPENPEARLEGILSCMNGEIKQATMLVLDTHPRTCSGIKHRISRLTDATLPTDSVFSEYCTYTLSPIGFLVQERFGQGLGLASRYFTISESGESYGQPLAAFSLKYAVKNGISLYELLGPTNSSGDSRAPYNRARIIELAAKGKKSSADLEKQLGLSRGGMHQHLRYLEKLGLLEFDSLAVGEKGIYIWINGRLPEEARTICRYKKLTEDVAKWLYKNKTGERNRIAKEIKYRHPKNISTILSGLAEQGLISTQFASNDRSDVKLCERAVLLSDYTKSVRSALEDGTELMDMKAMFDEFICDEDKFGEYLDAGIEIYNTASPRIGFMATEERETELLEFVRRYQTEYGRGPRPVEMAEGLGWRYNTVGMHANFLFRKGSLVKESDGTAVRYSLSK